jgi:uncharacterized protein
MRQIYFLFLLFLLTGCSFNGQFLRPTRLPSLIKEITVKMPSDTLRIVYGENFQPLFLNNNLDTIQKNYTIESVLFPSASGNKLNGWMITPHDVKIHTTLLHFHGNSGCLLSQYRALTPLLEYGYRIFVFDYSGFGFSEGKATRDNVLKDGIAAVEYAIRREDVKTGRLVIYGQSLGGHLSAVVASRYPEKIDALVIEGAFSSHKDIAAGMAGIAGRLLVAEKYSAIASIKKFHKPVLIIHSTEDKTIPFKLGKKLYENANEPKSYFEIKHCHICGPENYPVEIAGKIESMLNGMMKD